MGKRLRVVCHSWDGITLLAGNGYYILDKELDYSGEQNKMGKVPNTQYFVVPKGIQWQVVNRREEPMGRVWANKADAQELVDLLEEAYAEGAYS